MTRARAGGVRTDRGSGTPDGPVRSLDPRLLRYAAGVRTLLVASVLVALAAAAAVIAQAVLLAGILADVIIEGAGFAEVAGRLGWLAAVVAARAALAWTAEELAGRTATSVTAGLRRELLVHVAALGPRWRSGSHSGELAALATTGVESLHDYVARYLPQLVLSVLIPLVMLGYLFTADLTSAIIVAVTLPLIPLFMALVGWYTDRQTRAKWQALARLAGHFSDVIAGLPTLKVFGRARAQAAAVRRVTEDYRKASMVTLRVAFLSSMVLELLASLSVALVAVAIGLRLVYGEMTLEVGLAVLMLAPEAYLPLRQLGTQFHAAADGAAASAKVLALLDTPVPAVGTRTDVADLPGLWLDGVEVGGPGERGAVGPLDLAVPAGRLTVVTGPSGSGKTTLLQLLAGSLRPDAGSVSVTGDAGTVVPLADVSPGTWRSRVAWAAQGAVFQAGSIRENLLLGTGPGEGVDDDRLRSVLADLGVLELIDGLPRGWHTELGEAGSGLSQGQRQRLSLARALARDAPLLILDEPTAALDEETERRVLGAIRQRAAGRTVVLVTHRAAPLEIADHVVRLAPTGPPPDGAGMPADDRMSAVGPW